MWSPCVWLIDYECAWNIPVRKRVTSAHTLFVTSSLTAVSAAGPRLSRSLSRLRARGIHRHRDGKNLAVRRVEVFTPRIAPVALYRTTKVYATTHRGSRYAAHAQCTGPRVAPCERCAAAAPSGRCETLTRLAAAGGALCRRRRSRAGLRSDGRRR